MKLTALFSLAGILLLTLFFPLSFILSTAFNAKAIEEEAGKEVQEVFVSKPNESINYNDRDGICSAVNMEYEPIQPGYDFLKLLPSEEKEKPLPKKTRAKKKMVVHVSGYYTPEPGQSWYLAGSFRREKEKNGRGKVTASGNKPEKWKTIAADPKVLPLGTKVRLKGYAGIFEVEDTGSAIKGRKIDVYTGKGILALEEAMSLPRKLEIEIL